jgi:hypothetical protein
MLQFITSLYNRYIKPTTVLLSAEHMDVEFPISTTTFSAWQENLPSVSIPVRREVPLDLDAFDFDFLFPSRVKAAAERRATARRFIISSALVGLPILAAGLRLCYVNYLRHRMSRRRSNRAHVRSAVNVTTHHDYDSETSPLLEDISELAVPFGATNEFDTQRYTICVPDFAIGSTGPLFRADNSQSSRTSFEIEQGLFVPSYTVVPSGYLSFAGLRLPVIITSERLDELSVVISIERDVSRWWFECYFGMPPAMKYAKHTGNNGILLFPTPSRSYILLDEQLGSSVNVSSDQWTVAQQAFYRNPKGCNTAGLSTDMNSVLQLSPEARALAGVLAYGFFSINSEFNKFRSTSYSVLVSLNGVRLGCDTTPNSITGLHADAATYYNVVDDSGPAVDSLEARHSAMAKDLPLPTYLTTLFELFLQTISIKTGVRPGTVKRLPLDEVFSRLQTAAQRARFNRAGDNTSLDDFEFSTEWFAKHEFVAPKSARGIMSTCDESLTALSSFTFAVKSSVLARCHWYSPGCDPQTIALMLHSFCSKLDFVIELDEAKLDGSTSDSFRGLEAKFYAWFCDEPVEVTSLIIDELNSVVKSKRYPDSLKVSHKLAGMRLTGSALTTDANSTLCAFLEFAALCLDMKCLEAPEQEQLQIASNAYDKMGPHTGDDTITSASMDSITIVHADVGIGFTHVVVPSGCSLTYLGRIFLNAFKSPSSCQIFSSVFHKIASIFLVKTGTGSLVEDWARASARWYALLLTDPKTPVMAPFCHKALSLLLGPNYLDSRNMYITTWMGTFEMETLWPTPLDYELDGYRSLLVAELNQAGANLTIADTFTVEANLASSTTLDECFKCLSPLLPRSDPANYNPWAVISPTALGVQVRAYTKTTYTSIRDRNGARVSGSNDDAVKSTASPNPARANGKAAKAADVAHNTAHTALLLAAYKAAQAARRSRPVASRGPPIGKTIFSSAVSAADTAFLEAAGISDAMLLDPNVASRLTELFARHESPSSLPPSTSSTSGSNKL